MNHDIMSYPMHIPMQIRGKFRVTESEASYRSSRQDSQMHRKRHRRDIMKRDRSLSFDREAIIKVNNSHEVYKNKTIELKWLAHFDDCTNYGLTPDNEKLKRACEVDRLLRLVAGDGQSPILFRSDGAFKQTTDAGYEDLSKVADQILINMAIIMHDNSLHALRNAPTCWETAVEEFKLARRTLVARFRSSSGAEEDGGTRPKPLDDENANKKAYFALVDFSTACIARLLVRSAWSKRHYWDKYIISILACWSTKLKVLYYSPPENTHQSLEAGEVEIRSMVGEGKLRQDLILIVSDSEKKESTEVSTTRVDMDVTTIYYEEHILFRHHIERLLRNVLRTLFAGESSGEGVSCFELCNKVYETGLGRTLTVASTGRDGCLSASSDPRLFRYSWTGLELLQSNSREIFEQRKACDMNTAVRVDIEWNSPFEYKPSGPHHTSSLDDLVSILVPFSLASPWSAFLVDKLVHLSSSGTEENDPILQYAFPECNDYKGKYSIRTNAFEGQERDDQKYVGDAHVISLTKASSLGHAQGKSAGISFPL